MAEQTVWLNKTQAAKFFGLAYKDVERIFVKATGQRVYQEFPGGGRRRVLEREELSVAVMALARKKAGL